MFCLCITQFSIAAADEVVIKKEENNNDHNNFNNDQSTLNDEDDLIDDDIDFDDDGDSRMSEHGMSVSFFLDCQWRFFGLWLKNVGTRYVGVVPLFKHHIIEWLTKQTTWTATGAS